MVLINLLFLCCHSFCGGISTQQTCLLSLHLLYSCYSLKQKFPKAFQDLCFYSEVSHLLGSCSFRLTARRFIQELFEDLDISKVCCFCILNVLLLMMKSLTFLIIHDKSYFMTFFMFTWNTAPGKQELMHSLCILGPM